MRGPIPDLIAILRALVDHHVDFIVVGGVCAVLHGAPLTTTDLDIVHSRAPDNLRRLLAALQSLDTIYRDHAGRRTVPTVSHFETPGRQLLVTSAGPLDVLGTVSGDRGYDELLAESVVFRVEDGMAVRGVSLPMLIRLKEETNRDKDRAVLPVLRRTLEEKERGIAPPTN